MTLLAIAAVAATLASASGSPIADSLRARHAGQERFDVIIEGGRIVDGTGNAWFPGDVAILGDRVAAITPPGALRHAEARRRVDATGKVVSPGFIDIQSHSRNSFLGRGDARVVSKVTQGVTTEIMGESTTNAPVAEEDVRPGQSFSGPRAFDLWLRAMEGRGAAVNVGSFVGASTIRILGKGHAMGAADATQLVIMQEAVKNAMEDGAFGIASALIYPPGNFASTEELIEINRAAAPYGGVYITHLRSEADRLLEAMDEAIRIGVEAGVPVEIYHLKAAGRRNWDKGPQSVAKIDSARAAGVDVQANMYPYSAAGTGLTACFPPWASADGKLYDNLASPDERARMRQEMESQTGDWENFCDLAGPEGVVLLGLDAGQHREYRGQRLSEVARTMDKDWIETAFDLVLAERQRISTVYFLMSEENVAMTVGQPWMKFGTDAGGQSGRDASLVHPRAYGTFTRVLGRYVREEGATTLEEAVRKMSSAVATRLRIPHRGLLREGFYADVVVFDPQTVADLATYESPHQLSTGVEHVFVNGIAVVRDGKHTGAMPGRAVRGPGWRGGES